MIRTRKHRTRRNQRGGLFGFLFGPSASTLHQIIRNNNETALDAFLAKLSEDKKRELINKVISGETAVSLARQSHQGMPPNQTIISMLSPYQQGGRRTRTRKQRGGFLGFSNNDQLRMMIRTHPGLNITDICEQTLQKLSALGSGSVYSLSDEDNTALKQFEFVLSQNRGIKRYITTNSMSNKKREEIMNTFRDEIKRRMGVI